MNIKQNTVEWWWNEKLLFQAEYWSHIMTLSETSENWKKIVEKAQKQAGKLKIKALKYLTTYPKWTYKCELAEKSGSIKIWNWEDYSNMLKYFLQEWTDLIVTLVPVINTHWVWDWSDEIQNGYDLEIRLNHEESQDSIYSELISRQIGEVKTWIESWLSRLWSFDKLKSIRNELINQVWVINSELMSMWTTLSEELLPLFDKDLVELILNECNIVNNTENFKNWLTKLIIDWVYSTLCIKTQNKENKEKILRLFSELNVKLNEKWYKFFDVNVSFKWTKDENIFIHPYIESVRK